MGLEVGVPRLRDAVCRCEKFGDAASESSTLWDATGSVIM